MKRRRDVETQRRRPRRGPDFKSGRIYLTADQARAVAKVLDAHVMDSFAHMLLLPVRDKIRMACQ